MYKYAEIYGGKVRDIRESNLGFVEFCSIWDPTSFWLDVTGVEEIGIGWIIKSNTEVGTYFEEPVSLTDVTLETKKAGKLEVLDKVFKNTLESAYILSSLGFYANAGERAKGDVDGIITKMEAKNLEQTAFMDYDDIVQVISLSEAKILQLEIIENGESVYQQKWSLRDQINDAESIEEVESIEISLKMRDFLNGGFIGDDIEATVDA